MQDDDLVQIRITSLYKDFQVIQCLKWRLTSVFLNMELMFNCR